jgi:ribosomal protein L11 methyltransferase
VTIACTRAQGEAIGANGELPGFGDVPPVLVADEPDPSEPDEWLIHAYFEQPPTAEDLARVAQLGTGEPRIEELGEADWVAMSQSGLQPIRAGRFYVHTPTGRGTVPSGTVPF